jgi:hypothetical protein
LLALPDIYQEYKKILHLSESKENEKIEGSDSPHKQKLQLSTFEAEGFEMALLRTFWSLSSSLIEFKKKPQKEQDLKREFLHQENLGNLKNAMTTSGFPDILGRNLLSLRAPEFHEFQLYHALLKGHGVFDRAFNFAFKDNELTQKNSTELLEKVEKHEVAEDVRLYLNTILYKVEVASTEKSFNSMKRIITEALKEQLVACHLKKDDLEQHPNFHLEDSQEAFNWQLIKQKIDVISEYLDLYFSNEDFIFVDKQVQHLKKGARAEATEKSNKPILSDEFCASIAGRPLIQLITGLKKAYNFEELYLIKQHLLLELFKDDPEASEPAMIKFNNKKKLLLEALKFTRSNMILEDVFNAVSEQKKQFIETMEQELLRCSIAQLKSEHLNSAQKRAGNLISSAQRALKRKDERAKEALEEEKNKREQENNLGDKYKMLLLQIFNYAQGKSREKNFSAALEKDITPCLKGVMAILSTMERGEAKDIKKQQFKSLLNGISKKIETQHQLDNSNHRALMMWLKGVLGRIDYS